MTNYFDKDIIFIDEALVGVLMDRLNWDDVYGIAKALKSRFPDVSLEDVSLNDIHKWTLQLSDFDDDPQMSNDTILLSIYTEWFEEENPI